MFGSAANRIIDDREAWGRQRGHLRGDIVRDPLARCQVVDPYHGTEERGRQERDVVAAEEDVADLEPGRG